MALYKEARCADPVIVGREPHRARPPSPPTLDRWHREYKRDGPIIFLRSEPQTQPDTVDRRRSRISPDAISCINQNWKGYKSPRHLFMALEVEAEKQGWVIPSQSWLYRRWRDMPEVVKVARAGGSSAYEAKCAPFVPRDNSGLAALQVLCGDHSERDVTVLLEPEQRLVRPWLTAWQDLRTGLIWGWYLDVVPSSETAGLAYADGILAFGAQPFSRPEEDFYSYVYTDHGRTYKSHSWDGKVIAVHKGAMKIDDGLELLLVEKRVGIVDDFQIKHLMARAGNAKEKPVERLFRDISEWEANTFKEYCGKDARSRPDSWYELYARHERYRRGGLPASPFLTFESYKEALAGFIARYNRSPHERITLGGAKVVPVEEYERLYTTRYEISKTAVAMLLMKPNSRTIGKNGVNCFRRNWWYLRPAMSLFKGSKVEIRYTDRDYARVWVLLPDGQTCEATLITPTELLNPNRERLRAVAQARAHERKIIREFNLIAQSELRGETVEDRLAAQLCDRQCEEADGQAVRSNQASVQRLTRFDRKKLYAAEPATAVSASDVERAEVNESICADGQRGRIREFDFDD